MSRHFSNEQISSYSDGEASPAERAEIERLLETCEEARREYDAYRKLSTLLKSLPVASAPRNLSVNVSRKLGAVLPETAADSSPSKGNQSRRSLWIFAGSLTAIAAVLLISVKLFDFGPNQRAQLEFAESRLERQDLFDRELPERIQTATASDEARQLVADSRNDTNRSRLFESREALIAGEESKAFGAAPLLNKKAIPAQSTSVAADKPAVKAAKPIAIPTNDTAKLVQQFNAPPSQPSGTNDSGLIFENLQELKDADIGKMVTALEKTSAGITIVKLTVVDRQIGLKSLQVLLSRHRIPLEAQQSETSESPQSSADKSSKEKSRNVPEQSERLVAVYVQATHRQLSAALGDLRNSDLFQKLHVRGPIETAQLNRYSRHQVFFGASASDATQGSSLTSSGPRAGSAGISGSAKIPSIPRQSAQAAGELSAPVAANKPNNTLQKSGLETEKLADQPDAVRKNEATTLKELDRISRQLELSLSPDILTELSQATGQSGRNAIGSRSAAEISVRLNGTSIPPAKQQKNATKILQRDPLKVLFILVVNESNKPNASPALKPAKRSKKVRAPLKSSGSGAA